MSKHKKKEKKSKQNDAGKSSPDTVQAELARLRSDNEALRARLEQIAELAHTPISVEHTEEADVEDDEYEEMLRDVDDQIASDSGEGKG